jgi:uncharacterized membrane protein
MNMTLAHALSSPSSATHRALLFGSLALNLFLIGIIASLFIRNPTVSDRSIGARIERLAASLPASDGERLRRNFEAERRGVQRARAKYDRARDVIRDALRREPFDEAAMREAMGNARTARQQFDEALQNVIAKAAGEMSPGGRQALADWPPPAQRGQR